MDKRSLFFIFAVSLAFFGIQSWFNTQNQEAAKLSQNKLEQEQIQRKETHERNIQERTASLENLPMRSLYSDAKGENKIADGIAFGSFFLTLEKKEPLPPTAYLSSSEGIIPVHLAASGNPQEPILYRKQENLIATLPPIPMDCPTDLQLITLGETPRVVFGEQRGKEFSLPFHYLEEKAIALIQDGNGFLPVGVYDPEAKKIKSLNEFKLLGTVVQQSQSISSSSLQKGEEFYVLENEYQQLVFSTRGGALAEINLPLKSKENPLSLIKEIDFDREILKQSPRNSHFPIQSYYSMADGTKQHHEEGTLGGYYPLLRRATFTQNGEQKTTVPPAYYALNITGDDPSLAELQYRVTRFEPNLIQFEARTPQRKIIKTFSIPQEKNGPYCLMLDLQIEGDLNHLWLSSGVPDVELVGGSYSPLLRYQVTKGVSLDVDTIDLPKKEILLKPDLHPNWISNNNGFLGIIIDPLTKVSAGYQAAQIDGDLLPTRLSLIDSFYNLYPPVNYPGYTTSIPARTGTFRIFAGPFDDHLLKKLDALYENPLTNYNPNYLAAQSIQGWFSFISEPFAKFLFFLMNLFHAITRSWALSIILLTVALKAMMYPLNAWSIKSTLNMQKMAPQVKSIQEKFKKDPKRAQFEIMNLYKQSGVNPLTGCLPMLLQMPFLIGMFYLLKSSFPLRGAPFIPGWIDDLAAPDILFTWGQPLWFIGNELHLLPILMGASMFLQQKLTSQIPKDTKELSDTQKQQKMMGNLMSVLFIVLFYNFPSGLNLYFMFSTLLGVWQQSWMMKKMKQKETP